MISDRREREVYDIRQVKKEVELYDIRQEKKEKYMISHRKI